MARLWEGTKTEIRFGSSCEPSWLERLGAVQGVVEFFMPYVARSRLRDYNRVRERRDGPKFGFDRADGERGICRTVVPSNAEGSRSEFRRELGYRCERSFRFVLPRQPSRIGCVEVEPYEEQKSWSKINGVAVLGVHGMGNIFAALTRQCC
jgi:hypothetical protein